MPTWVVQFHYASADAPDATTLRIVRVAAESETEARRLALASAPSGEFIMTVVLESDEQALGTVKHRASWLAGKGTRSTQDPKDD